MGIDTGRLPNQPGARGKATDDRLFINAVLFVVKGGIPWRDLPPRFGNWNTVYVRFRRWGKSGVWQRFFDNFTDNVVKVLLIDSTTVRAHQHSAGAQKKEQTRGGGHRSQPGWANDKGASEL